MKAKARAAAGLAAVATVVVGAWPAGGTGYYLTEQRWGSASAAQGALRATVSITEVRLAEDDPDQPKHPKPYVCVGLTDNARRLQAAACAETPFTTAPDMSAARAVGSMVADIRRLGTGALVGRTTLRYDVRWTSMAVPLPRVYGGPRACPRLPWAPEYTGATATTTTELVTFGSATGSVSSPTLGTVGYRPATLTWGSAMGESVGKGVWTSMTAPVPVDPACYSAWANVPAGRVLIGD